jgi:type I restriction enzyme M protein
VREGIRAESDTQELLPLDAIAPSVIFGRVRDYLAGQHLGATRDAALLDQVLLCLAAKIELVDRGESLLVPDRVKSCYESALRRLRRAVGQSCLPPGDLELDAASLEYVDRQLALLNFGASDLVGDAYQCFRGADSRGQEGQFFTPPAAIRILAAFIEPRRCEKVIDPACGAGGFLFAVAQHLLAEGADPETVAASLFGVEKDEYLGRIARMRLALLMRRSINVSVGDSLAWRSTEKISFMSRLQPGSYDAVLTNPPFGSRIIAASESLRRSFKLAHRWVDDRSGRLVPTTDLLPTSPPQTLFVERCLSLVRPGGRVGMVVPESLLSGQNYSHVVEFLFQNADIESVVGMPEALFKTSGRGGTHTKTALLVFHRKKTANRRNSNQMIFMAEAAWCGHDSRGRPIPKNDADVVVRNRLLWLTGSPEFVPSQLGYPLATDQIRDRVLAPRSYDPEVPRLLSALRDTHHLLRFSELMDQGLVSVSTGDEVGKLAYGTGEIPFVRTSDLSSWEIKLDPKHGVSRDIYYARQRKQDVQPGDIFMVRDGTYLVGTCAMVTKYDTEIVFQSHLNKIRVLPNEMFDNYLLLAVLSSPIVQRQIKMEAKSQDIINSLGNRIRNLVLPIPRSEETRRTFSQTVEKIIRERVEAREAARSVTEHVAAVNPRIG